VELLQSNAKISMRVYQKPFVDLKERCTVLPLWIWLSKGVFLSEKEKTF